MALRFIWPVPGRVKKILPIGKVRWSIVFLWLYKFRRLVSLEAPPKKNALLPAAYKVQIQDLDVDGANYNNRTEVAY
ncbi:MAG TPA: hypothetical protein VIJ27_11050 [Mucilaginibacter sp.]